MPWMRLLAVYMLALAGCGASTDPPPTTPAPVEPGPQGTPVQLVELIPPAVNGLAVLQVRRIRSHSHGPAFTNMVRRIGVYDWEQALDVDLRTEVESIVIYGVADEQRGPGDLSAVLDALRSAALGAIVQLRVDEGEEAEPCTDLMLGELSGEAGTLLDGAASGWRQHRCGEFLIVRPVADESSLGPHQDTPIAAAIEESLGGVGLGDDMVFAAMANADMIDRVSCGEQTVALTGWQVATIELARGMVLRGRYHAEDAAEVEELEQCVSDGMGGFSNVPLFAQLELGDVLENATIARDESVAGDVTLEAPFSESELDLMLGLMELVGSGIQD